MSVLPTGLSPILHIMQKQNLIVDLIAEGKWQQAHLERDKLLITVLMVIAADSERINKRDLAEMAQAVLNIESLGVGDLKAQPKVR